MELCSFRFITPSNDSQLPTAYKLPGEVQEWIRGHLSTIKSQNVHECIAYTEHAYTLLFSSLTIETQLRTSAEWEYERDILPYLEHVHERVGATVTAPRTFATTNIGALYALARVFDEHSRFQEAEVLYRGVLKELGIDRSDSPIQDIWQVMNSKDAKMVLSVVDSLGVVLRKLGKYTEAGKWAQHAYKLTFEGKDPIVFLSTTPIEPIVLQRITNLASCLQVSGDVASALSRCQSLEEILKRNPQVISDPSHGVTLAEVRKAMAEIFFNRGEYDKTLDILHQIQSSWNSRDDSHPLILEVRRRIAASILEKGDYQKALAEYESLIADKKRLLGEHHFSVLSTVMESGFAHSNNGNLVEAQKCFETAGKGYIELFKDNSHPALLRVWRGIARIKERQWNYREACVLYEKVMTGIAARALGEPEEYDAINSIANCCFRLGRYVQALDYYRKAEEYYRHQFGEKHIFTLTISHGVATVLEALGKYKEALKIYKEVWEGEQKEYGDGHPDTLITLCRVGAVLERMGKYTESESKINQAIDGLVKAYGESYNHTVTVRQEQARLLESQGKYPEALNILESVITERKKIHVASPWAYLAISSKARILGIYKRYDEAIELLDQSLASWTFTLDTDHPWALEAKHSKGRFLAKKRKYGLALTLLKEVFRDQGEKVGKEHPATLQTWCDIALVESYLGKLSDASHILENAVEGLKNSLGEDHPTVIWAIGKQEKINRKLKKRRTWLGFGLPKIQVNHASTGTP